MEEGSKKWLCHPEDSIVKRRSTKDLDMKGKKKIEIDGNELKLVEIYWDWLSFGSTIRVYSSPLKIYLTSTLEGLLFLSYSNILYDTLP